jgi:chromate transporter
MREDPILALIAVFVPISLVSVGGGPSVFAAIQHQSVDVHHWMNASQFLEMFAISRAAPGPGSMLVTLIGLKAGGIPGALVATLALFAPSSILCYVTLKVWNRFHGHPWHHALERGLAPIGGGLILAGALAIGRMTGWGWLGWSIAAASAAAVTLRPRLHPLVVFAVGGVIFACVRNIALS